MIYFYPADKSIISKKLIGRKELYNPALINSIKKIFFAVENNGDTAIIKLTKKFDSAHLDSVEVSQDYISNCVEQTPATLTDSIHHALGNIKQVNAYLLQESVKTTEIRKGTIIGEKITPLDSVGLYVPARKGPLISTALMLVGAAKTAGVKNIYVGMAPNSEGKADPATVTAAHLAGADRIFVGNGVGLIAGFTIGTASVPEVHGIFGPGPGGIAAAMSIAFSYGKKTVLGIGPTDSVIFCDETADPELLIYDLINEAEHGPDSSSVLVTTSEEIAYKTLKLFKDAVSEIPEGRKKILNRVFSEKGYGGIMVCESIDAAIEFINDYAPEHMNITCSRKTEKYIIDKIQNTGEILIGQYTPFTAANYAIGITAVLPTNGYAKNVSGITSKDMVKVSTIGKLSREALKELLPVIREIGRHEGLPSHVLAAERRFQ